MSSFANVRLDLNTLEQFFALTLEQEAELNSSLRGFFVKYGIPNTRPSQWLQDLTNAMAMKHSRSQGWLVDKVARQTAKLADTLPVANMDARLTSIHAFAVTKSEAISNLQEEFFRLADRLKDDEQAAMADVIEKTPQSFAELSTKYQYFSERLEELRPFINFLSRPQLDITSFLRASTHFGDAQRHIFPTVQALIDLASERAFVVHEATRQRLQACAWDDRTSARIRARAIDAMRGHRERLISLAEQQVNLVERLEREITKACINPLHVVELDGNPLVLHDLFSAASKYKSLCLSVMRTEEVKHVISLRLIAAQSTFVQVEFRDD